MSARGSARDLPPGGEGVCPDLIMAGSRERERSDDSSNGLLRPGLPRRCILTRGGVFSVVWPVEELAGFRPP